MNGNSAVRLLRKSFPGNLQTSTMFAARTIKTACAEVSPYPNTREVEEIKIPVPWGHIAAKWWGPKDKRPILMVHGWQDNCGTFNTLVPHLRGDIGYLALDLPGHGFSSHFPHGTNSLQGFENVIMIQRVLNYFKWDRVSFIGHSMGAIGGYIFSSFYPDKVDLLICLDSIKPITIPPQVVMKYLPVEIEKYLNTEENIASGNEPPSYSYDEMIERLYSATHKSIDKDKCHHILERNITRSAKDPNKFYFSRDSRLKVRLSAPVDFNLTVEMAKKITCPMLAIKALNGPFFEEKLGFYEVVDILKKNNPRFNYIEIPGRHHVHLNEPKSCAVLVNEYLNKYAQHLTS